jgi:zinc protease
MSSGRFLIALATLALALGCSDGAKVYRLAPKTVEAGASAAPADPEPWRNERPSPGEPGEVNFPTPKVEELPNGLKLYVLPRPAGLVRARLVVRHGASSVAEGKAGLAALTARMLTEGTQKRNSLALAQAAESLGSTLEAEAERDASYVELSAFPEDLDRSLELLAEVVTRPSFDAKEFERVRAEWLDGLVGERQSPDRLAALAGLRVLNGAVHGAPVGGGVSAVKALSLKDLTTFHATAYTPGSAALFLVGNVGDAPLREKVERYFGAWKQKTAVKVAKAPLPEAPTARRVVLFDRPGAVQTAVFVAQRFPARSAEGYEVRQVLGSVVGGLFTSRINMNLREKNGYTYGASGHPIATREWGAFLVSTSVRSDVTAQSLEQIFLELERARNPALGAPIEPAEVKRAKSDLLHTLGAKLEHTTRVLDTASDVFVDGLDTAYFTRYPGLLAPIGPREVGESANSLTPDRMIAVLVGDAASVRPALEAAGFKPELGPEALLD